MIRYDPTTGTMVLTDDDVRLVGDMLTGYVAHLRTVQSSIPESVHPLVRPYVDLAERYETTLEFDEPDEEGHLQTETPMNIAVLLNNGQEFTD